MRFLLTLLLPTALLCLPTTLHADTQPTNVITFNDDGAWCWFQDERALVVNDQLVFGTVASGSHTPERRGNVEVCSFDLTTQKTTRVVLHKNFELDDHDVPALVQRADGRLLAMYCKHHVDNQISYRITQKPGDATSWQSEEQFVPSEPSMVTYANLYRLAEENHGNGRLYNFYRGFDDLFKPSWMVSDNDGQSWESRGLLIESAAKPRLRPYVKYASDGLATIHLLFTEGHPRDFDNSLYHAYYRDAAFYETPGKLISKCSSGPLTPEKATRVFAGDPQNVAWASDLHVDEQGHPVACYSVQKDAADSERGNTDDGQDIRYRYARWDGNKWHDHEVAYAGIRLYAGEDDYSGNICLDPDNLNVIYLSSNVDIRTGHPNKSGRYEIYRGVTTDLGKSWSFESITRNSSVDNIRPLVPKWNQQQTALLWLQGTYRSYTDYDLAVVGCLREEGQGSEE